MGKINSHNRKLIPPLPRPQVWRVELTDTTEHEFFVECVLEYFKKITIKYGIIIKTESKIQIFILEILDILNKKSFYLEISIYPVLFSCKLSMIQFFFVLQHVSCSKLILCWIRIFIFLFWIYLFILIPIVWIYLYILTPIVWKPLMIKIKLHLGKSDNFYILIFLIHCIVMFSIKTLWFFWFLVERIQLGFLAKSISFWSELTFSIPGRMGFTWPFQIIPPALL